MSRAGDLALLAEVVTRGRPSAERLSRVEDWPLILDRAARFMILPTLADALAGCALPADADALLEESRANTAARNGLLRADLTSACRALNAATLPFVAMKGAAMLLAGLVHPAARHLEDIDLLIPLRHLDRIIDCLTAAGFQFERHLDHRGLPSQDYEVPGRGPRGTLVELHLRPPGSTDNFDKTLSASRAIVAGDDARAHIPSNEALLEQLSDHVLFHHAIAPLYLMRHLADVRALLAAGTRAHGLAATASVALFNAVWTSPRFWAELLMPAGVQLQLHSLFSDRVILLSSLLRTARHPSAFLRRLFPHRSYLIEHYGSVSAATYVKRLVQRLVGTG